MAHVAPDLSKLQSSLVTAITSVFTKLNEEGESSNSGDVRGREGSRSSPRSSRQSGSRTRVRSRSCSGSDEDFVTPSRRSSSGRSRSTSTSRVLPSAFNKGSKRRSLPCKAASSSKKQYFEYERDIILLPKEFGTGSDSEDDDFVRNIPIPRSKEKRSMLAENGLIGKIVLTSAMTEKEIFSEIRNVFAKAMDHNAEFQFTILQHSGGGTKCLVVPAVSSNYSWSASAVAGRNAKTAIYILAREELKLKKQKEHIDKQPSHSPTYLDENMEDNEVMVTTKSLVGGKRPSPYEAQVGGKRPSPYEEYINLISSSDNESTKALTPPMSPLTPPEDNPNQLSLEQILEDHRKRVLSSDQPVFRISVRRRHIFADAVEFLKRGVPAQSHLRVTFLTEPAVDAGGPCREFCRILMHEMMTNNMLFRGPAESRVPTHNMRALHEKTFLYVGQFMSLSIIHGGPGPKCLAHPVVDYILHGFRESSISICDIPDEEVKAKLFLVDRCSSDDEIRDIVLENYEFFINSGLFLNPGTCGLKDKADIIVKIGGHNIITSVKAELDQLIDGLKLYGVLDIIKQYSVTCRELFVAHQASVSASDLQDLFSPRFSLEESNQRQDEERVYMFWVHFLHNTENLVDEVMIDSRLFKITLEDVLVFGTGAAAIPPTGFHPTPAIHFEDSSLPRADTCALQLFLPLKTTSLEHFSYRFYYAIINSPAFGQL